MSVLESVAGQPAVKGVVTLKSYYADSQPVKVVAIAFADMKPYCAHFPK